MKRYFTFLLTLLIAPFISKSQVSVSGPACALPGITYQYLIQSADTTGAGSHVCITGGTFTTINGNCINDSLVSVIYVVWNTGINDAIISVNSSAGNTTDTVTLTNILQGGAIDSALLQQNISDSTSPLAINCSAATGGTCAPSYQYQWQQSADNVSWADITSATNQNMDIPVVLTQTTFFRRKVVETVSSAIGYSNVAAVYVSAANSGGSN